LTLRDLAKSRRITSTSFMSSTAAIVHQILHSEANFNRTPGVSSIQPQTRTLRAILRITRGMELAWVRMTHRGG
jgi:hypothetical protein